MNAVVLLSGGLDSATVAALANEQGHEVYALSFDYGQTHAVELDAARRIAASLKVSEHRIVKIDLSQFGGSALTDRNIAVPETPTQGIPITYVPARNTVFLSLGLAWAEVLDVQDIFIGVNAVDYSGYPDCRPEFIKAFEQMANLATRSAVEGRKLTIHAPLIEWSKADILKKGTDLGVDYSQTISCYQPDSAGRACARCDSCRLRAAGFAAACLPDVTRYQPGRKP
ncbi:MAG: 7-cyano-7-deazaguanine synthase QueC [Proteobacteria bacterium]|nr:7-cyano-7-deazaguanine synthase QueC [Pseudomonadota bacterium]